MIFRNRIQIVQWAAPLALALLVAGCASSAEPPMPTRPPAPTFTPTTEGQVAPVDPAVAAAAATAAAQPPAPSAASEQPAGEQPTAEQPAAAAPAPEQPTTAPTPTPEPTAAPAEVVINSQMNVRGGPGTNYNVVGAANQGQRYPVTGKNNDGTWWQIDFNGQPGWVFAELVSTVNTESVAVAVNIPAPPPPTATSPAPPPAPPTNTPVPQPAAPQEQAPAPEAPAPAPVGDSGSYEFNRAILQRCDPNAGVTYVQGTVYKGGQPVNGYNVAFSYAADGPVVASVISGPHEGYTNWNTGYYSHILQSNGPREGNWFFWITDGTGKRISKIANVQTHGEAGEGKCQQATIDFDS